VKHYLISERHHDETSTSPISASNGVCCCASGSFPHDTSLPQMHAGRIKAYAVTAPIRLTAAPEILTVDEAGFPKFYMSLWHGLWARKGTPTKIVARLNAAVVAALAEPQVQQRLADMGQEIFPRERQNPAALAEMQKAEIDKWWPIIKAAGIKAE
jgi:tripartite-type tricarboxylate transporter receptor subunit TctC